MRKYCKNPLCIDCGKKLKNHYSIRCKECSYKYYKGQNHFCYKKGIPKCIDCGIELKYYKAKRCKFCQNIFQTVRHRKNCLRCNEEIAWDSTYCNSCRMIIFRKNNPNFNKGKNHYNWKDGASLQKYPNEFFLIKDIIKKRDSYICQNCNMTEEEHLIVYGSVIEVHHIDYNKKNNDINNLITLCKQCNIRANYNREYWEELLTKKVKEVNNVFIF